MYFRMPDFLSFFPSFQLPKNLAGDISLILLFLGFSLAMGFIVGRWKLINILINVYISLAFINVLPERLLDMSEYGRVGIFVVLLVALTAVDKRLFDLHISNAGTDFFWRLFVMSILVTGMVFSSFLYYLPQPTALQFISMTAYGYFASPTALLFWLAMPILSLLFINNRLK